MLEGSYATSALVWRPALCALSCLSAWCLAELGGLPKVSPGGEEGIQIAEAVDNAVSLIVWTVVSVYCPSIKGTSRKPFRSAERALALHRMRTSQPCSTGRHGLGRGICPLRADCRGPATAEQAVEQTTSMEFRPTILLVTHLSEAICLRAAWKRRTPARRASPRALPRAQGTGQRGVCPAAAR